MNQILSFVICVSVASVIGGMVRMLAPNGSMATALHTAVGIFLIACFFLPLIQLKNVDWSVFFEEEGAYDYQDALAQTVDSQTEFQINLMVKQAVEESAAACQAQLSRVSVELKKEEQGGYRVERIEAELFKSDEQLAQQLEQRLKREWKTQVKVT